jgi:hypothetical protein
MRPRLHFWLMKWWAEAAANQFFSKTTSFFCVRTCHTVRDHARECVGLFGQWRNVIYQFRYIHFLMIYTPTPFTGLLMGCWTTRHAAFFRHNTPRAAFHWRVFAKFIGLRARNHAALFAGNDFSPFCAAMNALSKQTVVAMLEKYCSTSISSLLDNDCTKTHLSIHCPGVLLAISKSYGCSLPGIWFICWRWIFPHFLTHFDESSTRW